ncbi:hypothetical protein SDRG_12201 [Saprolegnia diclina VS20]|uniref:Uncharacterized protein n=1 Tax=Saprolegnia diclina (strain VS20) TaxID=1156394 RepID=T0RD26_SAPDV|nr:hypothetical protein SDRG_12201 [Saprolegnia diclina VS20]EQC30143.1 hypothetical protein SDRG_12201 [Saprolegnia diclina VS20]|eukprot:XP_008616486.1 hypothetical protein SDRG_12201 [Saprolegnia diclina VS20]
MSATCPRWLQDLEEERLDRISLVVRLLLDANANLNAKNNDNQTALDWAVEKKHNDVAQLLSDHPERQSTKTKVHIDTLDLVDV